MVGFFVVRLGRLSRTFVLIDKLPTVIERFRQFRRWLKEKTNGRVK